MNWDTTAGASLIDMPGYNSLNGMAVKYRLVSLGYKYEFVGSNLNNQGLKFCGLVSRDEQSPLVLNDLVINPRYDRGPAKHGCSSVWRPEDNIDFEYRDFNGNGFPNNVAPSAQNNPALVFAIVGAQATTSVGSIDVWWNYEYIPALMSQPINKPVTSKSNILQFQEALNAVGDTPISTPLSNSGMSSFTKALPYLTGAASLYGAYYGRNRDPMGARIEVLN